jgi:hypothetical protein
MSEHMTPVMLTDSTGYIANWIIGGVVGAAVGAVASMIYSYCTYGEINWELVGAGAITGALIGSGSVLLYSTLSSSMSAVSGGLIAKHALASVTAQVQSNLYNDQHILSGVPGALVGGAFSAIPGAGAIGLSGAANAFINEFQNEIFWDNDSEVFSWKTVKYETAMYSMSNFYGYMVGGTPLGNYVFDTIIYPVSDQNRLKVYP